ncbi:MAG: GTP pyrophosphokinase family protein [Butyrivibrio sp.]|nr:GTP pyrophosphokinase family protein [Butyrivibrio sp.]
MKNKASKKSGSGIIHRLFREGMTEEISTELATMTDESSEVVYDQTKKLMSTVVDYKELMMMYGCAMKEIQTKFEILNTEFNVRYRRNPIASINTRLKKTASIADKLNRHELPFSLESIEENISDVAGVRIICSYIDDIYTIADVFLKQEDITLVERKDYILAPKPNGYRSLHLIVKVPVFFADYRKDMKVEVQIRTIAMDFWASLEHQLKYKQIVPDQDSIIAQLKSCADAIAATDQKMLDIRNQIEEMADTPTNEDILFEKLSRLDVAVN